MTRRLAVCSWSLQPDSPSDLVRSLNACAVPAVQLALDPIRTGAWNESETIDQLRKANIEVISGMMATEGEDYSTLDTIRETGGLRPDSTWPTNLRAAEANAELAARLGLKLVTLHAGFIPHDRTDLEYASIIERLRTVADLFAARGIRIGLETGQETAPALLAALADLNHPSVGINFDPANMILYAMGDPVEALSLLAPHILQIHIKDATPTATPGQWGTEVPAGTGAVDWPAFFSTLSEHRPDADLVIERESGDQRIEDIRTAASLVAQHTSIHRV